VNIDYAAQLQGRHRVPAYCASRAAVAQLTRRSPTGMGPQGHSGQRDAPGLFARTNNEALQDERRAIATILARLPAARWGKPPGISPALPCIFSSPASKYVTGTVTTVDGGWMGRFSFSSSQG